MINCLGFKNIFMPTEELILKALDKCLETAKGEQRRLFVWMKAALQFPGLNQFAGKGVVGVVA